MKKSIKAILVTISFEIRSHISQELFAVQNVIN